LLLQRSHGNLNNGIIAEQTEARHASKPFRAQYEANAVGVTRFGLAQHTFRSARIPLPPLPEQERIAAYLDASCASIDTAVRAKGQQLETLDALRRSIIAKIITRGLNANARLRETGIDWIPQIPEHWEVSKLNTLFWFRKGDRATELTQKYIAEYPGEYPVYSGQTANAGLMGRIDSFEFDFSTPVVFVTTVGARAMTTRLVSGRFSLSQNCALIIPWHAGVNVNYYEPTIQTLFDFERRSIALIMQPSLRFKDLKKFRVPKPPRDEQLEIVASLDRKTKEIAAVAKTINDQITVLIGYRKSLIHECVTGQRRISEADFKHVQANG
jgi:type I restriction enzyme, S subunit